WEPGIPLFLGHESDRTERRLYRSARVGLSLKKSRNAPEPPRYIMLPYRYLTEPRRISKGKLHLVLALHVQGVHPEEIGQITGSPTATIQRYIADFEAGRQQKNFGPYYGIDLGPKELCKLYGTWVANFG